MKAVCVLADGRRVPYLLQRRPRDTFWLVRFVGPDLRRVERSTKETALKRADDAACVVIREEYAGHKPPPPNARTWDEVLEVLEEHWTASNLRPESIKRYKSVLNVLRDILPDTVGPYAVGPAQAISYKFKRQGQVCPETLYENLNCLNFIWEKWLIQNCRLMTSNPWADVERPKVDKKKPKVVSDDQRGAFETWLAVKYPGWRLPHLFLAVKSYLGCRIGELAAIKPSQLRDGRVCFREDVSKGRKPRECKIPGELYQELHAIAGIEYVFQSFHAELRHFYQTHGLKKVAANMRGQYKPRYFAKWLEERLIDFRTQNPDVPYFKLHSLRATAISEVRQNGVPAEKAAVFFGVSPRVMAQHYEALDEVSIADEVADARESNAKVWRKCGDDPKPSPQIPPE
jgi:integrase